MHQDPISFDEMTADFTAVVRSAAHWKECYAGAVYSARLRTAIRELKRAIAIAEAHPEIGFVETRLSYEADKED